MIELTQAKYEEIKTLLSIVDSNRKEGLGDIGHKYKQSLEVLKSLRFIVSDEFDELEYQVYRYRSQLFSNNAASFVVLPTLDCNFNCQYCYEYKKPIYMSRKTEKNLVSWINGFSPRKRHISIGWFGGEPLLCKDTMSRISEEVIRACIRSKCDYSANLTTNGYLLDDSFINRMPTLRIRQVQVTIDGTRDDHNLLRPLKNGAGSFDKVFDNIISFCEIAPKNIGLTIRVNCGDENLAGVSELLKMFPKVVRNRVRIYFRWIWANEATLFKDFAHCSKGKKAYSALGKLYSLATASGFEASNPHMDSPKIYCEVDYTDHYDIDPLGNVYFCSHKYDGSDCIANLNNIKDFEKSNRIGHFLKWYTAEPFSDPKCLKCILLPVCCGGCRKERVEGKRQCIDEKYSLDEFVKQIYREKSRKA